MQAMIANYYKYWGKAKAINEGPKYHLLPYHSLDVAACGNQLLSDDYPWVKDIASHLEMSTDQLRRIFTFFLALHDIGKFARAFQGQVHELSDQLVPKIARMAYDVRHDSLGFWLWRNSDQFQNILAHSLGISKSEVRQNAHIRSWFEIVTGHHGQPPEQKSKRIQEYFDKNDINAACEFLEQLISWTLTPEDLSILQDKNFAKRLKPQSWRLAGLAVLADWLGSNQEHFNYHDKPITTKEYWLDIALPSAQIALETANLKPLSIAHFSDIKQLFPFINQPTPLQQFATDQPIEAKPQLFILEDVTGAGKTEAAMILVHRLMSLGLANGLYVGLPTMATANAMYLRLANCYRALYQPDKPPSLILAHGARHLSEAFSQSLAYGAQPQDQSYAANELSATAYCNAWFADSRKKALLADIGVGTIDQALLGILPVRHQSLRLLGLGKKVLLVDEVHAYDPYMKKLLECLLEMHASQGGSAILLSATLPKEMKQDLVTAFAKGRNLDPPTLDQNSYPLATQFPALAAHQQAVATRKEVARKVKVTRIQDTDTIHNQILHEVEQGHCICWIRNTVDEARQSYEDLCRALKTKTTRVHLFHSRFAMSDRQNIENQTLDWFGKNGDHNTRQGRVLISTQVVEQSLDLDFDILISDLAPIDLLLQRAGRLQRHTRDTFGNRLADGEQEQRPPAEIYIHSPEPTDDANTHWLDTQRGTLAVYQDLAQLWRSARVLFTSGEFRMPEDARYLIETVYAADTELTVPAPIEQASYTADGKRRAESGMADLNMLKVGKGYTRSNNETGWSEEVNVPTRLSDKTVSVVLVMPTDTGWKPYADHPHFAWDFSTLKIRESLWKEAEQTLSPELIQQMETLREQHKALRWHCLFPLTDQLAHWYDSEKGWMGNKGDKNEPN